MKDMAATAKTTSRPTPKGDLPMTQIPYPHTPVEVGPYPMNVRLCRSGEFFFERLTHQMVQALEWLVNRGGVQCTASIIRVDMVPMTQPSWGLQYLQGESLADKERWRAATRTFPVFEVETGCPSVAIPYSFFQRLKELSGSSEAFDLFRAGIAGRKFKLFQHRPEDASIYRPLAEDMGWEIWQDWELLAAAFEQGTRKVYASVPPGDLPAREWFQEHKIQLAGTPWLGKAPWTKLFGGLNLTPKEIRGILESWSDLKELPLLFKYAASNGFYLKPNLGACCEGSENQSSTPGQLRARLETALDTGTTLVLQPLHDPRPFFAPDCSCWNEIWRFYLGIDDTGKYRAIAGTGVSSRGDWVHGSKNSVSWPLLPPLPSKP